MAITIEDIKADVDKDYQYSQITRERASNDLVFYFITHWDDNLLSESQLAYRGEFDILKKAGRHILTGLTENPVQIDFEPIDQTRDDGADLLDGLYRTDDNNNVSIESYENGKQEAVVCGVGAWLLYTDYVSLRSRDKNQVIRRKPIWEANNTVFWDANARLLDKSDATHVAVLAAYSEDGYKKLVKELTGEELEAVSEASFKHPEHSYVFPWIGGEGSKIYVASCYYREKIEAKVLTLADPFGDEIELLESSLKEVMDDLIDQGYSIIGEKTIEKYQVTKYIASGAEILNGKMVDGERVGEIIAGEHIPVVPVYGEHAIVEGEEHYEGITRLAKDPQRLRNFSMSYVADILARSPRIKPIYWPEQIAGFEDMYSDNGIENHYGYGLMNRVSEDGADLPGGPVGVMPEQPIPNGLPLLIDLTRQSVEDVANPGIPQDIADPDMSGKAIHALQARLDMQSVVYQTHYKHAKRRDAEIYASMAAEIYDAPRAVMVTKPDGTRSEVEVMQSIIDKETGDIVVINDLRDAQFEVYSKIGPSYSSQREQTVERIMALLPTIDPGDPIYKALQLKALELMDGVDFDDIRDYANLQLVLMGMKKPETEEQEQALIQAQQQPKEPSADMVLAQGEMMKGQAALEKNKIEAARVQGNFQNEQMKRMIDKFEAMTDRFEAQVAAQKAGAEIDYKRADKMGVELDNMAKVKELQVFDYKNATDEELFMELAS